ncbi:MAG: hypothetical protein HQK54_04670, partial [Oligoflexales bacterium]|nr:hypothetical protein [Oligoflexales bacterium]
MRIKPSLLILFIFLSTVTLTNCIPRTKSWLSANDGNNTVIVAAFGGYLSCSDGNLWGASFIGKVNDIEGAVKAQGKNFQRILSCYDSSETVHYSLAGSNSVGAGSVDSFLGAASGSLGAFAGSSLYVIGHSYGGWTTMRFVAEQGLAGMRVKALSTVDPISKTNCQPSRAAESGAMTAMYGNSDGPCTQFPSDANTGGVKGKTDFWANYYQTEYKPLHSGSAPGADKNEQKSYGKTDIFDANNSHVLIWNDGVIWGEFKDKVLNTSGGGNSNPGSSSPAAGGSATKDQCKANGMSNDGVLCTDIGITEGQ